MVMIEDPLSLIKSYDEKEIYKGLRIFEYEGLSLRQRENLKGLWKDRKASLHMSDGSEYEIDLYGDDGNNIQVAICLQALYRRANALYNTFLQNRDGLANITTMSQALRYFNDKKDDFSEDTQHLCETIEKKYSLPKPEYLLLVEELSRILTDSLSE